MRIVALLLLLSLGAAHADDLAPGGTLRAAFLANNPAQALRAGENDWRGTSIEMTRELARRRNLQVALIPLTNPPAVIEAVA